MLTSCGCMCKMAGHYGICQITASPGRYHIVSELTVTPGAEVCQACFDAVLHAAQRQRRLGPQPVRAAVSG